MGFDKLKPLSFTPFEAGQTYTGMVVSYCSQPEPILLTIQTINRCSSSNRRRDNPHHVRKATIKVRCESRTFSYPGKIIAKNDMYETATVTINHRKYEFRSIDKFCDTWKAPRSKLK